MGGKLNAEDKKTLLDACKDIRNWLMENGDSAGKEEFEERKDKLSLIAFPITSKLYQSRAAKEERPLERDEL